MPQSPTTQSTAQFLKSFNSDGFTLETVTLLKNLLCELDAIIAAGYHQENDVCGVIPFDKERYDAAIAAKERLQAALTKPLSTDVSYLKTAHQIPVNSHAMQDLLIIITVFLDIDISKVMPEKKHFSHFL